VGLAVSGAPGPVERHDYFVALALESPRFQGARKRILLVSILTNLAILFSFNYFDFFAHSMQAMLRSFGVDVGMPELRIILPVGISFYTFQSMSYIIDVYQRKIEAERNIVVLMAYVAAFPQLVAGPIERADHLLGQIKRPNPVDATIVREAVWLLCRGFFMKEVVADSLAPFVDMAFSETQTNGWMTIFGTLGFGIQIYCDFNAYSLIARGCGLLNGLDLLWNFRQPYVATSIQDFWRRWHISLSTWLRDYLYIPLGGNRKEPVRTTSTYF
jgi:D-alanyl-lipoteichoic acid acyltransferase DltB (MBOAT superfamily)